MLCAMYPISWHRRSLKNSLPRRLPTPNPFQHPGFANRHHVTNGVHEKLYAMERKGASKPTVKDFNNGRSAAAMVGSPVTLSAYNTRKMIKLFFFYVYRSLLRLIRFPQVINAAHRALEALLIACFCFNELACTYIPHWWKANTFRLTFLWHSQAYTRLLLLCCDWPIIYPAMSE